MSARDDGGSRQAVKKAIMEAHAALARDEDLAESFVADDGRGSG